MEIQESKGHKVPFPLQTAWNNGTLIPVLVYEAMGTALLVIAFNWSGPDAGAIALTLFAAIIIFGQVSGGHFNPCVTIAVLIRELMKGRVNQILYAPIIIAFQLIGATLGALFVGMTLSLSPVAEGMKQITGLSMLCPPGSLQYVDGITTSTVCRNDDCGDSEIIKKTDKAYEWCNPANNTTIIVLGEIIGTAFFVSMILSVKFGTKSNEGIIQALSICLCLFAMAHVSLATSGGCLNLAIAIAQSVFQNQVFQNVYSPTQSLNLERYHIPLEKDSDGKYIFTDQDVVNPVVMTGNLAYDVTNKSMVYYIAGGLIGAVLAGVKATFNEMEYKNAEKAGVEAELKEGGLYKDKGRNESFLDKSI